MKYRLSHILEYAALRAITGLLNALPYRVALVLGWTGAGLGYLILRKRMKRTNRRLGQVFGDRFSEKELNRIGWHAWRNLFFNGVEMIRTPSATPEFIKKVFDLHDFHILPESMKNGRGAVIAVPHMGNWELSGIAVHMLGIRLMAIARSQKNPLVNAYLNRMREYTGVEAVLKESKSFVSVIRKLREGACLAILPDVRAKRDAVTVQYLGVQAQIPRGMALFAREAGVPIIPACPIRIGWARHTWKGFEPVWPNPELDKDTDIQRMTQQVMSCFDQAIREQPDQYFWFNSRWVLGEEKPKPEI